MSEALPAAVFNFINFATVMSPSEIDYKALLQVIGQWVSVVLGIYLLVLIILRVSGLYRIDRCPNCDGELKRAQRTTADRLLKSLSFNILSLKRYRCYMCYWEGPALQIREM